MSLETNRFKFDSISAFIFSVGESANVCMSGRRREIAMR